MSILGDEDHSGAESLLEQENIRRDSRIFGIPFLLVLAGPSGEKEKLIASAELFFGV